MLKRIFAGMAFFSAVIAHRRVIVLVKPTPQQQELMLSREGDIQVREDLSQRLSQERLKELEVATGRELVDVNFIGLGGRVLSTTSEISDSEMENLLKDLRSVPWVESAEIGLPPMRLIA